MIINQSNLADLRVGFSAAFREGFGAAPTDWTRVAMNVPSTTAENHYAWLGQMPGMREWLGERAIKQMASYDYRLKNKTYEVTVGVAVESVEDDQYGIYTPMMTEMGRGAGAHYDELVFGLLQSGFSETCYDGQYFFDTDHPVGRENKVSVSNSGGGSGTPWFLLDTSRAIKPLIRQLRRPQKFVQLSQPTDQWVFMNNEILYGVDGRYNVGFGLWQLAYGSKQTLDASSFNAAIAAMQSYKSDEGRPLGINPTLLVVPPTLRAEALEIVKAERNAAGATNINRNAVDVLVTPWLA